MGQTQAKKEYRVGLALSGGGAKGFAHIGALKALESKGMVPDVISGVSAGSLIGVLYADGYTPDEIIELFADISFSDFATFTLPQTGFFKIDGFRSFLKRVLRAKKFEDLTIPTIVTATDLVSGTSVEFSSGPIVDAVCASCSIPVLFSPVVIRGIPYVDGGVLRNFPVVTIRDKCQWVIGVNVSPMKEDMYKANIIGIAERSYSMIFKSNSFADMALCDVLIQTKDTTQYTLFDLKNMERIATLGYNDTLKELKHNPSTPLIISSGI